MTTILRLHQPLHQLPLLKHSSIVQTEGLHSVPERAASITVQHVSPILFVHRHHLTLHGLWPWDRLSKAPGSPVSVAVKAEGVGSGLAEVPEAFFALDVVGVGRNEQTARLQLDAVARAESEGGPFCQEGSSETIRTVDFVVL